MIRALVPGDRDWLAAMLADFFDELSRSAPGRFAPDAARIYADLYLSGGDFFARVFESDGEPLAILLARHQRRPARLPPGVLAMDVAFTAEAARGRGLMSELLDQARDWCQKREIGRLELSTPVAGPARDYWARRGFGEDFVAMSRPVGD